MVDLAFTWPVVLATLQAWNACWNTEPIRIVSTNIVWQRRFSVLSSLWRPVTSRVSKPSSMAELISIQGCMIWWADWINLSLRQRSTPVFPNKGFCESFGGWMLKALPVSPRVYIYRYYNIDPTEGLYCVRKYVRKSSKINKKIDKALCPIVFLIFKTILGPTGSLSFKFF